MIQRYHHQLLFVCLILFMAAPLQANAIEIDFTRYVTQTAGNASDSGVLRESFFGVPGDARLIVTTSGSEARMTVLLNDVDLLEADQVQVAGQTEIPVSLVSDNVIAVTVDGGPDSMVSVRVKQRADIELHVDSRVHFNTNVSNFVAAREFYGMLGFQTLTGFPDTNTLEMAHAIGITTPTSYDGAHGDDAGGYHLHGELIGLGGFAGGLIDLIEFMVPKNEEAPYVALNHLGMARAVMHTTNIAADYEYMKQNGVSFISPPVARASGARFAIFKDLDGTHYELLEISDEDEETETTHIVGLAHVNINVSDFERSQAWYQMLGYEVSNRLPNTESLDVARAMGFDEEFEVVGAIVTHPEDDSTLELVQWIKPYDPERAYPIPVNHLGMHRMAFSTTDIAADVATLKAQGVEFVSEVTPCCSGPDSSGSIVAFYDPDGTIVELVEQPFMAQMFAVLKWVVDTFF